MKYRRYSDEFKRQAVEEYLSGAGMNEVLRKYDLHRSVLRRWRDKYLKYGSFPDGRGKGSLGRPHKIDTTQMTKDEYIAYLEMENEILKKLRSLSNNQQK